jgi:hypothetical protein
MKKIQAIVFTLLLMISSYAMAFQTPQTIGGDKIICHCTLLGSCKASGAGTNCAQSSEGGNIQCSDYDGNC